MKFEMQPTSEKDPHIEHPTLDDVLRSDARGYGFLNKMWRGKLTKALREQGIPTDKQDEIFDKITNAGGRTTPHLARMYGRFNSPVEHRFAEEWLNHDPIKELMALDESTIEEKQKRKIKDVLNMEGLDTCMFWTFSPYVYDALTNEGVPSEEALKKTIWWTKDAAAPRTVQKVTLPLLNEAFEGHGTDTFTLSEDPEDISHKYTKEKAKEIAQWLLSQEQSK